MPQCNGLHTCALTDTDSALLRGITAGNSIPEADFTAELSLEISSLHGLFDANLAIPCIPKRSAVQKSETWPFFTYVTIKDRNFQARIFSRRASALNFCRRNGKVFRTVVVLAITAEKPKKRYPGEAKGFVEEMRFVAMKLHSLDQAKEGEKGPNTQPIAKWEPSIEGYLRFLVDSKVVYDTLERIVEKAACPWYAEFRNTSLKRSEKLAKDWEWFEEQGHTIPEPFFPGLPILTILKSSLRRTLQHSSATFTMPILLTQ